MERVGEGYDIIANENLSVPPIPTPPRNKALLRGYEAHHCPLRIPEPKALFSWAFRWHWRGVPSQTPLILAWLEGGWVPQIGSPVVAPILGG